MESYCIEVFDQVLTDEDMALDCIELKGWGADREYNDCIQRSVRVAGFVA